MGGTKETTLEDLQNASQPRMRAKQVHLRKTLKNAPSEIFPLKKVEKSILTRK